LPCHLDAIGRVTHLHEQTDFRAISDGNASFENPLTRHHFKQQAKQTGDPVQQKLLAIEDRVSQLESANRPTAPFPGEGPALTSKFSDYNRHFLSSEDTLPKNADSAVWIDFVADLGDGFDSTYAMASLLAQKNLNLGTVTMPRGQALFMGGDEVYPKATENAYRYQLRMPYIWASPDPNPASETGVPLYAVSAAVISRSS
jgi:hypothetical protein